MNNIPDGAVTIDQQTKKCKLELETVENFSQKVTEFSTDNGKLTNGSGQKSEISIDEQSKQDIEVLKESQEQEQVSKDQQDEEKFTLSKRQQKKLRKKLQWEEKKKEKRLKEREKYKQRRLEAIAKGESPNTGPTRKQLKKNKSEKSQNFLQVVMDLDFDDMMIEKDIAKCVKQLLRIYTINRRSSSPALLHFCGIKENGRIHKCLEKNDGYQNWDVKWHFKPFSEVLDKSKLVYLTSDSDNELNELDKDAIYIIGGLVDHNHMKGYCLDKATKLELRTARLPLNKYIDIKTRTVLCSYHVFEILLRISEGKNWTETLLQVLPTRKGAKQKSEENEIEDVKKDESK